MITWMQRHKKWLVVTIWISTIAFVGAGFVGWGSYSYNSGNGLVAKVGQEEITYSSFAGEYNTLYARYKQQLGDDFNEELAQKINLQNQALNNLVRQYLLLNYAKELGFSASSDEIAQRLLTHEAFTDLDGVFSKDIYLSYLKRANKSPTTFEEGLAKEITINKLRNTLYVTANKYEIDLLSSVYFSKDDVSINIINNKDIQPKIDEAGLRAFYEKVKDNYKSPYGLDMQASFIDINDDELTSKKNALKTYLDIKKNKSSFSKNIQYFANNPEITKEVFLKISQSKGEVLKPIKIGNKFAILKLNHLINPVALEYDVVKDKIKQRYASLAIKSQIDAKVQKLTNNFKGENIGYVSRGENKYIGGLSDDETKKLIEEVFISTSQIGFVKYSDKTVVYRINNIDTVLFSKNDKRFNDIEQKLSYMKNVNIFDSLIKKLNVKYQTINYASDY